MCVYVHINEDLWTYIGVISLDLGLPFQSHSLSLYPLWTYIYHNFRILSFPSNLPLLFYLVTLEPCEVNSQNRNSSSVVSCTSVKIFLIICPVNNFIIWSFHLCYEPVTHPSTSSVLFPSQLLPPSTGDPTYDDSRSHSTLVSSSTT